MVSTHTPLVLGLLKPMVTAPHDSATFEKAKPSRVQSEDAEVESKAAAKQPVSAHVLLPEQA